MSATVQKPLTAEEIVEKIIEDIEESVYMGSMYLCLSKPQQERMKRRWAEIVRGGQVAHDWANY